LAALAIIQHQICRENPLVLEMAVALFDINSLETQKW